MGDNSAGLHESTEVLKPETIDRHRAVASIMEELEAVDWYDQRIEAASDPELAAILAHNRDEEKEHAAMTLEWLRRHDPKLDEHLRTYLFTDKSVLAIEHEAEHGGDAASSAADDGQESEWRKRRSAEAAGSLGIGSLKSR
jgi:ferritin-like protein